MRSKIEALINYRIIVRYPDLSILDDDEFDDEDGLRLSMPSMEIHEDTPQRHDPTLPLVEDAAVDAHVGRENMNETSTFLLVPTNHRLFGVEHSHPNHNTFDALVLDLRFAQTYVGETFLSMITAKHFVHNGDAGDLSIRVCVVRSTRYRKDNDSSPHTVEKRYHFAVDELMTCKSRTTAADIAIRQLFRGYVQSDARAYRHADFMANTTDHDVFCLTTNFKPSRHLGDLVEALRSKLKPADPAMLAHPDTDQTCISCTNTWNSTTTIATTLTCGHIVCQDCIVNWASEQGLVSASCPMCRAKIFQDPIETKSILHGLRNGIYHHDNRYTDWENFERSCADLDSSSADNSETWIVVNGDLLAGSWESITQGAFLELADADSPEATFLNPLASPEWRTVEQTVRDYFVAISGADLRVKTLHKQLMHHVFDVLTLQFRQAGLDRFLTAEENSDLANKPWFLATFPLGVRPGLRELLHRCLHRMLRLVEVRKCDCHPGFHLHGLRTYYDPASFVVPVTDDDGDVMME